METFKPFAVAALLEDMPQRRPRRGQVGTVVEPLAPGVFEDEFSDNEGRTYATLALRPDQLMILHHDLAEVAWPATQIDPLSLIRTSDELLLEEVPDHEPGQSRY